MWIALGLAVALLASPAGTMARAGQYVLVPGYSLQMVQTVRIVNSCPGNVVFQAHSVSHPVWRTVVLGPGEFTDLQFYGVPEVRFRNNLGLSGVTDLILNDGFTYTFVLFNTGFLALV
jgi:hypothetical protein